MITLEQAETDNIGQMITLTNDLLKHLTNRTYEIWSPEAADNINRDRIKLLSIKNIIFK